MGIAGVGTSESPSSLEAASDLRDLESSWPLSIHCGWQELMRLCITRNRGVVICRPCTRLRSVARKSRTLKRSTILL